MSVCLCMYLCVYVCVSVYVSVCMCRCLNVSAGGPVSNVTDDGLVAVISGCPRLNTLSICKLTQVHSARHQSIEPTLTALHRVAVTHSINHSLYFRQFSP